MRKQSSLNMIKSPVVVLVVALTSRRIPVLQALMILDQSLALHAELVPLVPVAVLLAA
jgi:hypothetical protein